METISKPRPPHTAPPPLSERWTFPMKWEEFSPTTVFVPAAESDNKRPEPSDLNHQTRTIRQNHQTRTMRQNHQNRTIRTEPSDRTS